MDDQSPAQDTTDLGDSSAAAAVYQHESKPDWGIAVIAWERDGKRGYLFENGELRILKDGYYHLMVEVDVAADRAGKLVEAADGLANGAVSSSTSTTTRRRVTLDEQLDYFAAEYPAGFADEAWRTEHRGDSGRALKRHRDPALERAQEVLAQDKLDSTDEAAAEATLKAVVKLLSSTDLVPTAQARTLVPTRSLTAETIVSVLRDVLWGDEPFGPRFNAWRTVLANLGKPPTWMLATAPLALAHPQVHICVKSTPFRAQAATLAPRLDLGGSVSYPLYQRAQGMADTIRERATARNMPPADLLDVHDFVCETMKPKVRTAILAARE